MSRGRHYSADEDRLIRLWKAQGKRVTDIGKLLGRSRRSVYMRLDRMRQSGELDQDMLPLGDDHER